MPANSKVIAKNTLALYVRMGIMLVVSLYTARVVLQQLGASDYGTYNVVGGIVAMLNFMTAALAQGVQRFFNYHKGKSDIESFNKTFWSAIVIMALLGAILLLLSESVGLWFLNAKMNIPKERLYAANWVFQFSIISMLTSLLTVPFNAVIVAHEDFGLYAYVSIGVALLNLGISLILQIVPFDKVIFYSFLICMLQVATTLTYMLICRTKYKSIFPKRHRDKEIYRSFLSFSGWNILGTSSYIIGTQGVNMVLNIFFGTIVNAARGIANQISTKVDEFINNVQQAMNPQIVQLYSRGEINAVRSLVYNNFRWNFALYWLIALPILFEIEYILKIWLGEVPQYTSIFTRIIVLRSLIKCFERPINSLNFAIGKMKHLNIFASVAVALSVVLMWSLFTLGFPPYWAFFLDVICVSVCTLFYMTSARRYHVLSFRTFGIQILIPIVATIFFSSVGTYTIRVVCDLDGFSQLMLTLFCSTAITSVCVWFVLFSKDNRKKILSTVKGKLLHSK